MENIRVVLAVSLIVMFSFTGLSQSRVQGDIYSFSMKTIDGERKSLSDYKGKVLLIVNTASRCGFTPQLGSMETLYQKYKNRGFEVLAFPANNFMGQEPGSDQEIKNFCFLKFKTTFQLFSKTSVKGADINPFYSYLTKDSQFKGPISWNFNKFLVDTEGGIVARYGSNVDPLSEEITAKIEGILPK